MRMLESLVTGKLKKVGGMKWEVRGKGKGEKWDGE